MRSTRRLGIEHETAIQALCYKQGQRALAGGQAQWGPGMCARIKRLACSQAIISSRCRAAGKTKRACPMTRFIALWLPSRPHSSAPVASNVGKRGNQLQLRLREAVHVLELAAPYCKCVGQACKGSAGLD